MSIFKKESSQALLTILSNAHAIQYHGTDDMMIDDCNDWISSLTDEEVSDIVLKIFHQGI